MTKNNSTTSDSPATMPEQPYPPQYTPSNPEAQIMDFITTLSDHMSEAFVDLGARDVDEKDHGEGPSASSSSDCEENNNNNENANEKHKHCKGKHGRGRHGHRGPEGPGPWEHRGPRGHHGPPREGFGGPWAGPGGPGGFFGFGGRGGFFGGPRGGHHGFHGPRGPHGHGRHQRNGAQEFTPSVDIFNTPAAYVLHVALAGAKKEDVGLHYDADHQTLQISGVVHRSGDEEFLKTIVSQERNIGAFERHVKLGKYEGDENVVVDEENISAKMVDGVLEITVPKREKTEGEKKRKILID